MKKVLTRNLGIGKSRREAFPAACGSSPMIIYFIVYYASIWLLVDAFLITHPLS